MSSSLTSKLSYTSVAIHSLSYRFWSAEILLRYGSANPDFWIFSIFFSQYYDYRRNTILHHKKIICLAFIT